MCMCVCGGACERRRDVTGKAMMAVEADPCCHLQLVKPQTLAWVSQGKDRELKGLIDWLFVCDPFSDHNRARCCCSHDVFGSE